MLDCDSSDRHTGRNADRVTMLIIAVAMLALELLVLLATPWTSPTEFVVDVGGGILALALVPLLVQRPVVGGTMLGLLAAASPLATPAATCAMFFVAQRCSLRSALLVAGVGVAGHLVQGWWRPIEGLDYLWWVVLVLITYATLLGWGFYLQARRSVIVSLRERAQLAEADQARRLEHARSDERARIAREMHDVLAHRLSLVATHAGALEFRPDATPDQVAHAAGVVRANVHQALDDLRQVVQVLRAPDPSDSNATRPQPTMADLGELLAENRAAGAVVLLSDALPDPALVPATLGRTAYRVVQEGLTNARRHAPGQPVRLDLGGSPGGELTLSMRNGYPSDSRPDSQAGSGTGLIGVTERVEMEGGHVEHGRSGQEFRLIARLPWPA